jgi:hypothetical protein
MLTAVAIQNDRIQLALGELGPELIWYNRALGITGLSYFCGAK